MAIPVHFEQGQKKSCEVANMKLLICFYYLQGALLSLHGFLTKSSKHRGNAPQFSLIFQMLKKPMIYLKLACKYYQLSTTIRYSLSYDTDIALKSLFW